VKYEDYLDIMFKSLPMYQRQGKAAYKPDLNRTLEIDALFEHPHTKYKTIHIAGTNGKGSVSHTLASILQEEGYKVGLYTSPHLKDFRERIRINGTMISKEWISQFMGKNLSKFQELEASFFEMTVALAFEYFKDNNIDIAVIETGMGGRLDSTNIITPELSIITNIGFDHTAFLGTTIPEIATEKAGIIKKNVPLISGSKNDITNSTFQKKAKEVGSKMIIANDIYKIKNLQIKDNLIQIDASDGKETKKIISDLSGIYQKENLITVIAAIDELRKKINISDAALARGLRNVKKNTGLQGRWQKLNDTPITYCDVAHNEDGLRYVMQQLKQLKYDKLYFVLGVVNDKDLEKILPLFPKTAHYIFTQASIPRSLDVNILANKANSYGLKGEIIENIPEAFSHAKSLATNNDAIFIGGSTFTVAEIL
jgi:dihydrofolate synthase/folylpolyglutamate synthase